MTRLMVLGLLTYGPMSGYEMQQILQQSQTDKWAGILPGSIYHALKKLGQEGLVRLDSVEQTGNRSKAIYSITASGKEEFQRLVIESMQKSSVAFPTDLYTAMTFLTAVPAEAASQALTQQIAKLEHDRAQMRAGQAAKEKHGALPPHAALVFENIFEQYELQLSHLRKIQSYLNSQK